VHPNDIVLPASDRAISRIHCKIIYKDGFCVERPIPKYFLQFLMVTHNKKSNSNWKFMPPHILRHVWQFLKPLNKFYLVDIGSVYGSYIRVKPTKPNPIEKG
jgi:hypothetical protein